MSAMSDYLEDALITLIFRTGAGLAKPSGGLFVALFPLATPPTDAAGSGTEVATGATTLYQRKQHGPSDATWGLGAAGAGQVSNLTTIQFDTPAVGGGAVAWGSPVGFFAIFDALTAGNKLFHGQLQANKNIGPGDPGPSFQPGALIITFA